MNRSILILMLVIPTIGFINPCGFPVAVAEEIVTVSFEFPNEVMHQTTVTDNEVRQLLGRNFGYMVEWWIHALLQNWVFDTRKKS